MKDFPVKRFPGGKEFPMARISRWEGITGAKNFLVGRNSRCEGFPGEKISWWEGNPDRKDFQVENISQ